MSAEVFLLTNVSPVFVLGVCSCSSPSCALCFCGAALPLWTNLVCHVSIYLVHLFTIYINKTAHVPNLCPSLVHFAVSLSSVGKSRSPRSLILHLVSLSLHQSSFNSSSCPPAPPPFDLGYLCFPGEWKGAVPPFWGSHPGHTGPPVVQHTEAGGPQTDGPSGSPWRVSASDHGHGRLRGQLHSNRHQLPAYADSGQEQPASLWRSTPTRSSAVPSTTTATGAISIQWTVSSIIGLCSMPNCQTSTHLSSWF